MFQIIKNLKKEVKINKCNLNHLKENEVRLINYKVKDAKVRNNIAEIKIEENVHILKICIDNLSKQVAEIIIKKIDCTIE